MDTANLILGVVGALGVVIGLATGAVRLHGRWREWRRPPHPFALTPEDQLPRAAQEFRRGHYFRGAVWFTFRDDQRPIVVMNWFLAALILVAVTWIVVGNLLRLA